MRILFALSLMIFCVKALASLNILACTPEWGSLAKELGGDKVAVYSATTALQDPHHIEARPSLIARARSADLMVCTGAELEVGWAPLLQTQSGNPKIRAGQPGYFEAAGVVSLIEKPGRLDRAMGDIHAAGNPHLHLDPRNVATVADKLSERMSAIDPGNAGYFKERLASFRQRWRESIARWEQQAAPLRGIGVVVYHKNLTYLFNWLGMREVGALEPKPGLPPSTAHLGELLEKLKSDPARAVVRAAYNEPRAAEWLAERAKIPAVMLPFTVGGTENAKDLFGLYDDSIARLMAITK